MKHRFWVVGISLGVFLMGTLSWAAPASEGGGLAAWIRNAIPLSKKFLLNNVSPPTAAKGAIVASPSRERPDYFYHWIRDASLVTDVLVTEYDGSQHLASGEGLSAVLDDAVDFSLHLQSLNPMTGLGEPKFNADGTAFNGPWGRPQDDGPALRAIAFIDLADRWLAEGKEALVREKLYRPEFPATSLIKRDLEYVSHKWHETCFDVWEETRGHHFYSRMVQRKALLRGAELARRLGDGGAAGWYAAQAANLSGELERHWNVDESLIFPTLDRDGGADYKTSNLDTAVILGVLHGNNGDGFFSPGDERVLATAAHLEEVFQKLYAINDRARGFPGVAIGRYPEDRYDGSLTDQKGNPWVLATAAFAELYYRIAEQLSEKGSWGITPVSRPFFSRLGVDAPDSLQTVVKKLIAKGDTFLERIRRHGEAAGGHYSEQINRDTGVMQGAYDLTWSYASLITAIDARP